MKRARDFREPNLNILRRDGGEREHAKASKQSFFLLFVAKWSTSFSMHNMSLFVRKKREIFLIRFVERNFSDANRVAEHATAQHTDGIGSGSGLFALKCGRVGRKQIVGETFGIHMPGTRRKNATARAFALKLSHLRLKSLGLKTKSPFFVVVVVVLFDPQFFVLFFVWSSSAI